MLTRFRRYFGWALLALLILWMLFNLEKAKVDFFIMQVQMPIAFVILFSAAAGAAGLYLIRIWRKVKGEEEK